MKRVLIGILLVLVVGVGVGPFLVPVPPLADTVPPAQLADADSKFIAIDGLHVHYTVVAGTQPSGDAPTFVLLHGFGASVFTWRSVMNEFAAVGPTIAYDRTAFGLTERPLQWSGDNPYGTAAQVSQAIGLMDALHIQRAVLVGNSAGGRTAVDVALAHPERVAGLILVDPAVGIGGGAPGWLQPLLNTPQLNHLGPLLVRRISKGGGGELLQRAWHDPTKLTADVVAGYRKPLRANNWDEALWQFTRAPRTADPLPKLAALATIATLVISGDDDRVVPVEISKKVAANIPGSQLVLLPACGHVPQEECPAAFMHAVRAFMSARQTSTK